LAKGGNIHFADPETRLDKEYSRIYGVEIPEDHYSRPTTVEEIFNHIGNWSPENESVINIYGADSLAALSTEMEVDDKDKRGQNRAKKFSEGVRKTMHKIAKPHKLLICTNQIREGDYGKFTPGGWAIPFYASLRIELSKSKPHQLKKTTKYTEKGSQQEKVVGIKSDARCTKNTINDPFREAPIYIMFGYGIDDIRANLQYLKELKGEESYGEIANNYATIERAVRYIEDNDLEMTLKEQVIDAWNEVENKLKIKRKPKKRR
jgi:RecA/RadA recombinase